MKFIPDIDPRQQDLITHCLNWEPTRFGGYGTSPSWVEYKPDGGSVAASNPSATRLPNSLYAMWNATTDSGRLFVGYTDKLYEISHDGATPVFSDVTRASGNYNAVIPAPTNKNESDLFAQTTWDFTNVGNVAIATNKLNTTQFSISSGVFADLPNAPPARCCESVSQGFLMFGNTGNYGAVCGTDNMISWSALGNYQDFIPSNSTEAGYYQFTDTPGGITAIRKLGEYVVVYKRAAMYLGQYVGTPYFWSFNLISDKIGCIGPQQVVDIGLRHIFVGEQNEIYSFDGTRPISISDGFRDTLSRALAADAKPRVGHNQIEKLVTFYCCGTLDPADSLPAHLVWNYQTGLWGQIARQSIGALIHCKTNVDSLAWNTNYATRYQYLTSLAVSTSDGKLYNRRSSANTTWAAGSFLTGVIGNPADIVNIRRLTPVWMTDYNGGNWSATVTVTPYVGQYSMPGLGTTAGTAVTSDTNNRVDLLQAAHWHRFNVAIASATKYAGTSERNRPVMLDLIIDANGMGKD